MKTPRKILFERHRHAMPRLDTIRKNVLSDFAAADRAEVDAPNLGEVLWIGATLRKVCAELIHPLRYAWAGLAVLWFTLLAVNLEMKAQFPSAPLVTHASSGELVRSFAEQRLWLAELLPTVKPAMKPKPRPATPAAPGPRSQAPTILEVCFINDVKNPAAWGHAAYRIVVGRVPRPGVLVHDPIYTSDSRT